MRILFIHQNFPGQFRHLARALSQRKDCQAIGLGCEGAPGMPGLPWYRYRLPRHDATRTHPYLRQMEQAVAHGQAVFHALSTMKRNGFVPDVVVAHPGWGETLYLREVYPDTRLIHFCEWYYTGADQDFDPEFPSTPDDRARVRTWNALHAMNLVNCDQGVSPTHWQRSQHPIDLRSKILVQHEGIDLTHLGPDAAASFVTPSGAVLRAGDPVVTFVARNLEPYRGFHRFMRALEALQQRNTRCQAVIVGGDEVSYGSRPKDAANWREKLLREVRLDPLRTHFTGKLPHTEYRKVLQISAAHVYLTYPFVLSWSMLEAMACACLVIGSRTPPVEEVLRCGDNGILVDFFDQESLVERVHQAVSSPRSFDPLRAQARMDALSEFSINDATSAYGKLMGLPDVIPPSKDLGRESCAPHHKMTRCII